jgi:hypothetical protein
MPRKQVTIQVKYPLASLPAKWKGGLAPVLSHQFRTVGRRNFFAVAQNWLQFPAGLVSRVRTYLEQRDIRVRIDHQPPCVPEDLPDLFAGACTPEEWIDVLREHPCGLILIDQKRNAPQMLARCVNSFPGANVVVVAPSKREAKRLAGRAGRWIWRPIQLEADFSIRQRVLFTHPFIYEMCQDDVGKWNVAIFTEPHAAICRASQKQLRRGPRIRRYCLSPQSHALRPYESLWLEAVCGVRILDTCAPQKSQASVSVLFVSAPAASIQHPVSPPWKAKHGWYWHNESRNAFIARLAQALLSGDAETLRRLLGDNVISKWRSLLAVGQRSTTILVENEKHLKALTRFLPEWQIRSAAYDPEIPAAPGFGGFITTMVAAAHKGLRSRVVIRADGGAGWDEQIEYPPLGRYSSDQNVLILDVTDIGHPVQQQAVAARRTAYASYGWRCFNNSPCDSQ